MLAFINHWQSSIIIKYLIKLTLLILPIYWPKKEEFRAVNGRRLSAFGHCKQAKSALLKLEAVSLRCFHAYDIFFCFLSSRKRVLFGGERPLLCGGFALLSRHELRCIYVHF